MSVSHSGAAAERIGSGEPAGGAAGSSRESGFGGDGVVTEGGGPGLIAGQKDSAAAGGLSRQAARAMTTRSPGHTRP